MFEVLINDQSEFTVSVNGKEMSLNGSPASIDIEKTDDSSFHVLYGGGSLKVYLEEIDTREKLVRLQVNGKKAEVRLSTELDRLLKKLGLENAANRKAGDLKAPMPGLIHSISVTEGAEVKKGDTLLILEAMKMENVIKSPADGVIAKILAKPGDSVDKGAVLITFA